MRLRILLALLPFLLTAQESLVQEWKALYDRWYWQAPRARPENLRWSDSGRLMAYSWAESDGVSWRVADCVTGTLRPAFESPKIVAAFAALGKTKAGPKGWPFDAVTPLDDGRVRLDGPAESWIVETDQRLTPVSKAKPATAGLLVRGGKGPGDSKRLSFSRNAQASPSGDYAVEIRGGDVYLRPTQGGPERRLTSDAAEGKDAWVGTPSWSPDGRFFALWRERTVPVRRYLVTDSLKQTKKEMPYDKPGDDRTERIPWVFSVEDGRASRPSAEVLPLTYSTERLDWSADSRRLLTEYVRRGFTGHGIIEFEVAKKQWHRLLSEEDPKFVYSFATRFRHDLADGRTLWLSERSGWLQLYAVDLREGHTLFPVTQGRWVAREIIKVDEKAGRIVLVALGRNSGENPYHQHFCSVGLDGKGLVDLTPADGNHEVVFSPDGRTLVDFSSKVDEPPSFTLRSAADGHAIARLGAGDLTALRKAGWTPTVPFVAKDRDGRFDIWGVVTRPYPFDPKKKYGVIENIYAGPHGSFAPRSFSWWHRNHRELASLGFYVVQMDGRGTNHRGKEFQQESWRNLKDGGFPDRIAWIKALARTEPGMDLARIGIFGGSAGGQNTAHALLLHGDFYKAGAADCGCYDNRIDKLWWNEQWLGYPVGPWYEENSCARYAGRLTGRLFLSVGESDTNVDVKCSYDFRDALLAAGKRDRFEFHVVPGANHGAGESDEMREKRARFFRDALGGPLPL